QLAWTQDGKPARELRSQWENQWRSQAVRWGEIHPRPPRKGNRQLYQDPTQACSSILIQLYTDKQAWQPSSTGSRFQGMIRRFAHVVTVQRLPNISSHTVPDMMELEWSWRRLEG